jgi:hypothetical protein
MRVGHLVTLGQGHPQVDAMTRFSVAPLEVGAARHSKNCCMSCNWIRPFYAKFDRGTDLRAA